MRPARLELDHVAPPRRRRWPGILLLGLSLAVCADLLLRYRETATALEHERAEARAQPLPRAPRAARNPASAEQEKAAHAAVRQLALPWADLILVLEGASMSDVALLQLHPEAREQVIRITADARHAKAMFRYLRGLARAKGLSQIHLVSHEVRGDDPQRPVRFSAQASFRGMR
jgi:hypothetical protein